MIEIIKHGNTHKKIKCEECGCEFFFTEADAYLYESCREMKYGVKCPECQYPNNVKNALKGEDADA